jgi:hypothetical protein
MHFRVRASTRSVWSAISFSWAGTRTASRAGKAGSQVAVSVSRRVLLAAQCLGLQRPELVTFPHARRRAAACFACFERADLKADDRGSRFNASRRARERLAEGFVFLPLLAFSKSRSACSRVASGVVPFSGGGSLTPARRPFESPIAIACFVERAPCLPSQICSISSRTNSPACVVGAFPSRASFRARSIVLFSGIFPSRGVD